MFTLEEIKSHHSKVKTGVDFPAYIQAIKKIGVISYETFVSDLHTNYYGAHEFKISKEAAGEIMVVSNETHPDKFKSELKLHQHGKTDFTSFRKTCCETGIEKWIMDLQKMTCTYFDKKGNVILEESVPE